ncbi:MAG: PAS domain S-box protein [Verrucomicrobiota bacterium]
MSAQARRFLILEDNSHDVELLLAVLQPEWPDAQIHVAQSRKDFEALFEKESCHLVLADYMIPGYDGLSALAFVRQRNRHVPFIFFTGTLGEELAVESFRRGATDYVRKDARPRLIPAVHRALQEAEERSKLRQAEEVLRRTELQYRTLFNQSPDAIVVIDPQATLPLDFNDEACRQLECTRAEFAKLRIIDYDARHSPAEIDQKIASALALKRAEFEARHRTRSGKIIDVWVTWRTVEMDGRDVFYVIWRDLSEQKRTKAEFQGREEYFRALTELGSDLVVVLSPEGTLRYLSPSVTRVLGYDPEALLNRNAFELLHPEDEAVAKDSLQRVTMDEGWLSKVELRIRHEDGSWHFMEVVGRNLLANPNVHGVILNAWDVTDRKRAETQIREQAALLDKAQDVIIVCDLENRIQYWNRSAERVYGWTVEEAVGKSADQILFMAGDPRSIAAFKGLIAKDEWHGELTQVDRSGREIVVESRWSLVRDDSGQPKSILIINTDVTEHKTLQAQLLRAQRMESIGALAGGIAHDLNNVLAPILIAAELLREKITDESCRQWLDTLSDSARRGADVVRQILSFTRGTGETLVDVQVRHLITEYTKILKQTLPRSMSIEASVPGDLWLVKGNATQLSQVLMNLCVNARDAMPAGGQIRVRARNFIVDELAAAARPELKSGSYVVMSVADTGSGIPPAILGRIFEPFFTTKDVTKGTGLGLATVQGIIKSHGGMITVSSEPGKGTQFDVYLPAIATQAALEVALQRLPLPSGSGQCVLVVDDEPTSREMIRATLQTHGYQVFTAKDGLDALDVFRANQQRIALVLTDMAMPVMDGPSLIKALRATKPATQILALSGMVDYLGAGQSPATLNIHLLEKPCTAEELLTTVHRMLASA